MCHTWGLACSPAELQGGQGQGHQGVPLHVIKDYDIKNLMNHESSKHDII